MGVQERIAKLESLLERIRVRAQSRPLRPTDEGSSFAFEERPAPHAPEASEAASPATARAAPESSPPIPIDIGVDESVEVLEVLEDEEFIEIAEGSPTASSELDFEEEVAPKSAPRPAASISHALDAAADAAYAEEPPLKTPPPESGRQPLTAPPIPPAPAPPGGELAGASEIDALLETDPVGGGPPSAASRPEPDKPTMEQLGDLVELEDAEAADAELELEPVSEPRHSEAELEISLPGKGFAGGFDDTLAAPPSAVRELERHRERLNATLSEPRQETEDVAPAAAPLRVEVTSRPALPHGTSPVEFVEKSAVSSDDSFLSRLDASLALGK